MSLFITSDILNTIGTGNSGASKLVKIVFEGKKSPRKKRTRRKVRGEGGGYNLQQLPA